MQMNRIPGVQTIVYMLIVKLKHRVAKWLAEAEQKWKRGQDSARSKA